MRWLWTVGALGVLLAPAAGAQPIKGWFPAEAVGTAADRLTDEAMAAGVGAGQPRDRVLEGSRKIVAQARDRLDSLGPGVGAFAPSLPKLNIPAMSHPTLVALARFELCRLPLQVVAGDVALKTDERMAALILKLYVETATTYLRAQYVRGGGTAAEIEKQLGQASFNALVKEIETDAESLQYVMNVCAPAVQKLGG